VVIDLNLITLIAMPGGGKTTVGRQLAKRLGLTFIDTDHEIEAVAGCSVRELFDQQGEAAFRDIESELLTQLLARQNLLIATGGGIVLRPENRAALRVQSIPIYLRFMPEEIFRRVRHDTKRPLLQVDDPLQRLHELFAQRDPLYMQTARLVIESSQSSVQKLVHQILEKLNPLLPEALKIDNFSI
jgi:shikimate kinase